MNNKSSWTEYANAHKDVSIVGKMGYFFRANKAGYLIKDEQPREFFARVNTIGKYLDLSKPRAIRQSNGKAIPVANSISLTALCSMLQAQGIKITK